MGSNEISGTVSLFTKKTSAPKKPVVGQLEYRARPRCSCWPSYDYIIKKESELFGSKL